MVIFTFIFFISLHCIYFLGQTWNITLVLPISYKHGLIMKTIFSFQIKWRKDEENYPKEIYKCVEDFCSRCIICGRSRFPSVTAPTWTSPPTWRRSRSPSPWTASRSAWTRRTLTSTPVSESSWLISERCSETASFSTKKRRKFINMQRNWRINLINF